MIRAWKLINQAQIREEQQASQLTYDSYMEIADEEDLVLLESQHGVNNLGATGKFCNYVVCFPKLDSFFNTSL